MRNYTKGTEQSRRYNEDKTYSVALIMGAGGNFLQGRRESDGFTWTILPHNMVCDMERDGELVLGQIAADAYDLDPETF